MKMKDCLDYNLRGNKDKISKMGYCPLTYLAIVLGGVIPKYFVSGS